jgi:hypothetical protein
MRSRGEANPLSNGSRRLFLLVLLPFPQRILEQQR